MDYINSIMTCSSSQRWISAVGSYQCLPLHPRPRHQYEGANERNTIDELGFSVVMTIKCGSSSRRSKCSMLVFLYDVPSFNRWWSTGSSSYQSSGGCALARPRGPVSSVTGEGRGVWALRSGVMQSCIYFLLGDQELVAGADKSSRMKTLRSFPFQQGSAS